MLIDPLPAITYRVLLARLLEKSTTALQALAILFKFVKKVSSSACLTSMTVFGNYTLRDNQDVSKFYLLFQKNRGGGQLPLLLPPGYATAGVPVYYHWTPIVQFIML